MGFTPDIPNLYQGKQVIINSDRLLFNAKEDAILLFAEKAIGFSTDGNIHFDVGNEVSGVNNDTNKFIVHSPNIYLGLQDNGNLPTEPALLGDETHEWLDELLTLVDDILNDLLFKVAYIVTAPGSHTAPNPANFSALQTRKNQIKQLSEGLEDIKSKNTKLV